MMPDEILALHKARKGAESGNYTGKNEVFLVILIQLKDNWLFKQKS
jgi:hypothetical protein